MKLIVDNKGMIEVVFNVCYGGFSLSQEAILRMIELGSDDAKEAYTQSETLPYK